MYTEIENIVKDINSRCPIQIDQTIRLDSCEVIPEKTLKYNYTFLFIDATKIDNEEFKSQMWDYILYNTQINEEIRSLKDLGTIFVYSCKDERGNSLGELTFTPEDYNQPVKKPVTLDPASLNDDNIKKVLQEIVDKTQLQLPLFTEESGISMIDCRTFDKTLEYTCKLLNEDASRFDTIYFKTTGVPAAIQSLKDNPEMKTFAEQGVYISNIYLDKDGKYLCTITISPEEYL
jgi:hypothetical protein